MEKYKNLILSLFPYREDLDLDDLQRSYILRDDIAAGHVNIPSLIREFNDAISNPNFDWIFFAKENLLIVDPTFDKNKIIDFVREVLSNHVSLES